MEKSEYLKKEKQLRKDYEKKLQLLKINYVESNNTVKIGDIIKDHAGSIKVESIKIGHGFQNKFPEAVYVGIMYTKSGNPFKSGEKRVIYQSNMVSK